MPKFASARETIARLMRGEVKAPAPVSYMFDEPKSEREFTKGLTLSAVRYSGRKDFIGLYLTATTDNKFIHRNVEVVVKNGVRAVVFQTVYIHNGSTTRILKLKDDESVCSLSSTIFNFLREGIKCARLQKLHVYSSVPVSRRVVGGRCAPKNNPTPSSQSSSISPSTLQRKKSLTVAQAPTPHIVFKRTARLTSGAGLSLPNAQQSRSGGRETLHLPSATTN